MAGQDAQISFAAGRLDFFHILADHLPVRSHNSQKYGSIHSDYLVLACSFFSFSMASSIVPTR